MEKIGSTGLDTGSITFVKLDEWLGLSREDEATCEYFLERELIGPLQVKAERYLHADPEAKDPEAECARFDRELAKLGGADLVILGIGKNGHLGLNEPAEVLQGKTHCPVLSAKSKTHEMLTHTENPVERGITMGLEDLFAAERALLLADGVGKEAMLKAFLGHEITTRIPVSLLKLHKDCTCIINGADFPGV